MATITTYGSYLFALSIESLARLGTSTFQEQGELQLEGFQSAESLISSLSTATSICLIEDFHFEP